MNKREKKLRSKFAFPASYFDHRLRNPFDPTYNLINGIHRCISNAADCNDRVQENSRIEKVDMMSFTFVLSDNIE